MDQAAGWQADPTGRHGHRYWDGTQWTEHVADEGVAATDPYEATDPALDDTIATAPVAADTTASWPVADARPPMPPPYVPPSPVPDGGHAAGGSNRRRLLIGGGILAAVAVAVVAFLLLSGDDDDGDDVADRTDEPAPTDDTSGSSEPGDGGDAGSTDEGLAGGAVEETIADTYEEMFDLDREKAECLAERITEAIDSGELTEERAMSEIFGYLSECDVTLEEIGAN